MFGKLWETRSRLYRSRFLQANTRLKAIDEIYKIYTPLHLWNRSAFKNLANFRQTFWHFCSFIGRRWLKKRSVKTEIALLFSKLWLFLQVWFKIRDSRILIKILIHFSFLSFSFHFRLLQNSDEKFPEFQQFQILKKIQKMIFEKLYKG